MSRDNDQKRSVYKQQFLAPKSFLIFHCQKLFISFSYQCAISFTHASQNYCFFGQIILYRLCGLWQMPRQTWTIFWFQKRFQLLGCKTQFFKKDKSKDFWLIQNHTMGDEDFSMFMQFRNQLFTAAEDFAREKNLSPALIPTMSKDTDEQLKLIHKVYGVVDRANSKICGSVLR